MPPLPPSPLAPILRQHVPFRPPTSQTPPSPAAPKIAGKTTTPPPPSSPPTKEPELTTPLAPPPKPPLSTGTKDTNSPVVIPAPLENSEPTPVWIRIPRPRPSALPVVKQSPLTPSTTATRKRASSPSRALPGRAAPVALAQDEFQFPVNDLSEFARDGLKTCDGFLCQLPSWLADTETTQRQWRSIGRHEGFCYFVVRKAEHSGLDVTIVAIGLSGEVRTVRLERDHDMKVVENYESHGLFVKMFHDFAFDDGNRRTGFVVLFKKNVAGPAGNVIAFYTLSGEVISDTEIGFDLGLDISRFSVRDGFSQGTMSWMEKNVSHAHSPSGGWVVRQITSLEPFVIQTRLALVHSTPSGLLDDNDSDHNQSSRECNSCTIIHTGKPAGPLVMYANDSKFTGNLLQAWTTGGRYGIVTRTKTSSPTPPRVADLKTGATIFTFPKLRLSSANAAYGWDFVDNNHICTFASRSDGVLEFFIFKAHPPSSSSENPEGGKSSVNTPRP